MRDPEPVHEDGIVAGPGDRRGDSTDLRPARSVEMVQAERGGLPSAEEVVTGTDREEHRTGGFEGGSLDTEGGGGPAALHRVTAATMISPWTASPEITACDQGGGRSLTARAFLRRVRFGPGEDLGVRWLGESFLLEWRSLGPSFTEGSPADEPARPCRLPLCLAHGAHFR